MKALILAAGFGSRLAPITDECPKALVSVNGTPILFKQIDNLLSNGITDITIVSGYKAEILEARVKAKYPEINIINSVDYATTNNMYSAYIAKDAIGNNAFLMMNADVFYDSFVVKALLECEAENAIVTDIGSYSEESMKVIEKDGRLVEISKQISISDALGCSIDVYKFSLDGGKAFFDRCAQYIEGEKILNKWSEVALNDVLKTVEFKACPLVGRWFEIDNFDDLKRAEKLFETEA